MQRSVGGVYRPFLRAGLIVAVLSLLLACGSGEAPTPTPTAIPTAAPVATPTPLGPVATPTPTVVATPTSAAPAAEKPRVGGTLEDTLGSYTPSFDAQLLAATNFYFVTNQKLYNNLLINYEGQNAECEICSEWHLANNNKAMVFTLIPGIKFHSGQELTSEDVKYSLQMIMGQVDGIVSPRSGVLKEFVESVETPSKYEVRLNLVRPSAFVPKVLSLGSSVIYRAGTTRADLGKAPAGSGPYLLKRVIPGASWALERNPDYFKAGQPYIEKMNLTVVVDSATREATFLTHKIEYRIQPNRPPEQFLPQFYKLRDEGKINAEEFLKGTALWGVWMDVTKPPFNNLKLRQAVNLAVDRRAFAKVTFVGNYRAQLLVFYEEDGAYGRPEKEVWDVLPGWGQGAKKQQEIDQAKQLVKDAGYPTGLDIKQGAQGTGGANAELVQQELAKMGIRTTFALSTGSDVWQKRVSNLEMPIYVYLFRQTTSDPDEVIGQAWITGAGRSPNGYSNPEVDKLFVQMSSELDPAKKAALFKQIEEIIIFKDVAYAAEPGNVSESFWWKRLEGVTIGMSMHPAGSSGVGRSDRWWLRD